MLTPLNNPFAFPAEQGHTPDGTWNQTYEPGMTLRDYFAAAALQGLCANPGGPFQANGMSGWGLVNCSTNDVAGSVYDIADAMLAERLKEE